MASPATSSATSPRASEPLSLGSNHWWSLARSSGILLTTAIAVELSRLCLSPVYGAVGSSWHRNWEFNLVALVWISNTELSQRRQSLLCATIPTIGCTVPILVSSSFAVSGSLGPRWAPLLLSLCTSLPLIYLSLLSTLGSSMAIVERFSAWKAYLGPLPSAPPLVGLWLLLNFLRQRANVALQLCINTFSGPTSTRFGLQSILCLVYAGWGIRKRQYWVIILFLITLFNVHIPTTRNDAQLNDALGRDGFSLLARRESVTGYISVLDNVKEGYRVMRCDHSLLGGEWLSPPDEGNPDQLRESIYSVFVMLEAVRLVETAATRSLVSRRDQDKKALIIGLGIGTSQTALHHHGVHTTTIEIDPVVHSYALTYFSLPPLLNVVIADAVPVVKHLGVTGAKPSSSGFTLPHGTPQGNGSYDFIIHDVFTGGVEPLDLFTTEFLSDLSALLDRERGVIAINYAGDLRLLTAAAVVRTVLHVFQDRCRIFRESPAKLSQEGEEEHDEDFTNLVLICLHPEHQATAFGFRDPVEADYLSTLSRRHYLVPQHEINSAEYLSSFSAEELLTNENVRRGVLWADAQEKGRQGHWKVMRSVLPHTVWETW